MAALGVGKIYDYVGLKQSYKEFLNLTQYNVSLLESQPVEIVRKQFSDYFRKLKKLELKKALHKKQRILIYRQMHNILIRKIKRKIVDKKKINPEESLYPKDSFLDKDSPLALNIMILVELDKTLPDVITDCVINRVPLDGLRDLKSKVEAILKEHFGMNWDFKSKLQPPLRF